MKEHLVCRRHESLFIHFKYCNLSSDVTIIYSCCIYYYYMTGTYNGISLHNNNFIINVFVWCEHNFDYAIHHIFERLAIDLLQLGTVVGLTNDNSVGLQAICCPSISCILIACENIKFRMKKQNYKHITYIEVNSKR